MERPALTRYIAGWLPLTVLSGLLLAALLMMNAATQNSAFFGNWYSWLLLANVIGIVLLLALILLNVFNLIEQYRARAVGARLTLRLVVIFVLLSVLPVSVVFVFSAHTINRGLDTWFDVKIEQALDDALLLGRTALDAFKQDLVKSTLGMAAELEVIAPARRGALDRSAIAALSNLREQHNITELTLFSFDGKIIAASSEAQLGTGSLVPDRPSETVLAQVRQGGNYANVDATVRSGLRLRVVVPVYAREVGAPMRILQVMQMLPPRYAKLGESVQSAYAEYEKLVYLRGPLKFGFTLTLSLVAFITVLIAVWAALFSARRLVAPIGDLAQATRAVAAGDYRMQIPVTTHDELGLLVASFNDMTRRVSRAQTHIKRSQQEAELQRTYLETVLTHLSSGVLSLDMRGVLRTYNAAAAQILGVDLEQVENRPLAAIEKTYPALASFISAINEGFALGKTEWQRQAVLAPDGNARTLIIRGTLLPAPTTRRGGHVIVFDDVTALIQAQRDAAWAEVARRMAHEIKNPLTPIQLSAERVRHKYLAQLPAEERATLDRATHTIIEQVEALKSLVNAFADYGRASHMDPRPVELNELVRDVVELYRAERGVKSEGIIPLRAVGDPDSTTVMLRLELDPALPAITADAGRLRQLLHNLLLNARDALTGATKPSIRVRTRAHRDGIELTIEDNGPGFPEPMMRRLFEPYVTSKEKGTGLGLAIVKRIVEEHGGSIEAMNLKDGGAAVTLRLPLVASTPAAENEAHPNKRRGTERT
ncbi:MAG TPA: ATP-binding protein [Burkholderiales bacterium]|nr:ATP-binding protein [Burkholderiales bacterium]